MLYTALRLNGIAVEQDDTRLRTRVSSGMSRRRISLEDFCMMNALNLHTPAFVLITLVSICAPCYMQALSRLNAHDGEFDG